MSTFLVLEELKGLSDDAYKAFNKKIIPTAQQTLGVRLPVLRKIAARIAKNSPDEFIRMDKDNIYELVMLEGLVISSLNRPFAELLPPMEDFLEKVDNWAQVDTTVCNFRDISWEKEAVLAVVKKWLRSENEFVVRAGLVVLLSRFIDKQHLDTVFDLSQSVSHSGYYAYMGNAWLISVCMAKYPQETIGFFRANSLDNKTHNKAIQKSRESFRVSKADKEILNRLKR
ncbi:MAG: DNA alkylation repair protein [Desulfonatronovibrionaceae bacterium]